MHESRRPFTTMNTVQPLMHSFTYCLAYLREMLSDVAPADRAAQPAGLRVHPAWVIGHLTHVCQVLGSVVGVPTWLPDDWERRFGTGSVPIADAKAYEELDEALATLDDAAARLLDAVRQLDDAHLDAPFPDPAYLDVFPTVRHALTQVLVGHPAYHLGQLSMWRRAMGLPAMTRSFE